MEKKEKNIWEEKNWQFKKNKNNWLKPIFILIMIAVLISLVFNIVSNSIKFKDNVDVPISKRL